MIAHAKIKTDKIDATALAKLYASNFLPEVWIPDAQTLALRRQVTRRNQIVQQRVRLKTTTQSILHTHLVPQCPHADLFGIRGRDAMRAVKVSEKHMHPIISRADMAVAFMRLAAAQLDGADSHGATEYLQRAINAATGKSEFPPVSPSADDKLCQRHAAQANDIW